VRQHRHQLVADRASARVQHRDRRLRDGHREVDAGAHARVQREHELADGKQATLAFGAGRTGLTNLGNSCYLASVVQVLLALPSFQQRYFHTAEQHLATCASTKPAACFQCQMSKLALGVLSGKHDLQPTEAVLAEIARDQQEKEDRNLAVSQGKAAPIDPNSFKQMKPVSEV
jgi:hypothetical protein